MLGFTHHEKKLPAPYIKLYKAVNGINVYIVDGGYIRRELNDQFTNFGQHYRFPFIPINEFWLDQQHGHGEYKYYIDHLLVEHELMKKGRSYPAALIQASKVEKHARIQGDNKKLLNERLLKTINGVRICLVNGESVRDIYEVNFTEGGHDKVYSWVPDKTIYIDDVLPEKEREYTILHEVGERNLMVKGLDYNRAHNNISRVERKVRKKPQLMGKTMQQEYGQLGKVKSKRFGIF